MNSFKWNLQTPFSEIIKSYNIDLSDFTVRKQQFELRSEIHEITHTYRVILHSLLIGYLENKPREGLLAALGGIIHDMARKNEGVDYSHGPDAARTKFDQLKTHIEKYTITEEEQEWIKRAVSLHI